jgi:hypothetical protein
MGKSATRGTYPSHDDHYLSRDPSFELTFWFAYHRYCTRRRKSRASFNLLNLKDLTGRHIGEISPMARNWTTVTAQLERSKASLAVAPAKLNWKNRASRCEFSQRRPPLPLSQDLRPLSILELQRLDCNGGDNPGEHDSLEREAQGQASSNERVRDEISVPDRQRGHRAQVENVTKALW